MSIELLKSIENGDWDTVHNLLKQGVDPNYQETASNNKNLSGQNVLAASLLPPPLIKAVENNQTHMVKLLLDFGANPFILDPRGNTPKNAMHTAILLNSQELLAVFLEQKIIRQSPWVIITLLRFALLEEKMQAAQFILKTIQNISDINYEKLALIEVAQHSGDPDLIRLLMQNFAYNQKKYESDSALTEFLEQTKFIKETSFTLGIACAIPINLPHSKHQFIVHAEGHTPRAMLALLTKLLRSFVVSESRPKLMDASYLPNTFALGRKVFPKISQMLENTHHYLQVSLQHTDKIDAHILERQHQNKFPIIIPYSIAKQTYFLTLYKGLLACTLLDENSCFSKVQIFKQYGSLKADLIEAFRNKIFNLETLDQSNLFSSLFNTDQALESLPSLLYKRERNGFNQAITCISGLFFLLTLEELFPKARTPREREKAHQMALQLTEQAVQEFIFFIEEKELEKLCRCYQDPHSSPNQKRIARQLLTDYLIHIHKVLPENFVLNNNYAENNQFQLFWTKRILQTLSESDRIDSIEFAALHGADLSQFFMKNKDQAGLEILSKEYQTRSTSFKMGSSRNN